MLAGLILAAAAAAVPAPKVAAHQHLLSPATAALLKLPDYDGAALLRDLDRAGTRRGVVLSMGYTYGDERKAVADPDRATAAENDWTSQQVTASQGRLVGFCSVNPLRPAALAEMRRCGALPGMIGLKLHFANSGVSLRDPAQRRRLADVFALADTLHEAIVVHMRARGDSAYGAEDAQAFLDTLLPAAPHVTVQIAHLGGSGLFPADAEAAMGVFADAIARRDPRARHLIFDATSVILAETTPDQARRAAAMMRRVGLSRIVFGSDLPVAGNPPFPENWALFAARIPLRRAEIGTIAANVPAYMRPPR